MKAMKKIFAVLLATAMLCAVCTASAFAIPMTTPDGGAYTFSFYHAAEGRIEPEGTLSFSSSSRVVTYKVSCRNVAYESLYEYNLIAQCAINYDDGSQDYDYVSVNVLIGPNDSNFIDDTMTLNPNKTAISVDAEFFVGYNENLLWEGSIYPPANVLGINA